MTSARLNRGGGSPAPSGGGEGIRDTISLYGVPEGSLVIPSIPLDLIQYLNQMFPDRLSLVAQLGSVDAASGARRVIEHLIELHSEQQDNDHVLRRKITIPAPAADGSGPAAPGSG